MKIDSIPEFGEETPGVDYILRSGGYLIVRDPQGRIALLYTPQGFFLPGGGQEGNESPAQASVREAGEECGLRVRLNWLLGMADELVFAASEQKYYRKRSAFFDAELIGYDGGGEDDHRLMWMTAEKAILRLSHRSQAWAVMETSRLTIHAHRLILDVRLR